MSRKWLCALAALIAVGLAGPPALAAGSLTATFSKDSDWGTGYQAKYTVTNGTSTTVSAWTIELDLPAGTSVGTYWDVLLTASGNHYTFRNREYNGTVAPGASVTFGFVVSGAGVPANCRINGGLCAGGGGDTTAPSVPASPHVTGTTASSVSLAWSASTDNVGVTGYEVFSGSTVVATAAGTSATVAGLAPSTAYTFTVKARDAAGNRSGASASVGATTQAGGPGPGPGALPVAPYVDMGSWPTPVLTTMASASGVKGFTLAFITGASCRASWFNAYDPRTGWSRDQVDALRAAGGDVKISFGGASGIELAQACTSVPALVTEYQAVVDAYALKYIDLDIEGSATAEPASILRRSQALAQLQRNRPGLKVSLTLPVLPEGLTADGLNVVRSARDAGVDLDVVNIMAMDYYRAGDYGDFAVQAAQATFTQLRGLYPAKTDAQLWRMLGVTPMLGVNDDSHVYDQNDARQLVTFAKGKHLGLLAFWEVTRDRNACNGALYMCTNVPQQPYEFGRIFAGYTG
jgi:hypothetical protein